MFLDDRKERHMTAKKLTIGYSILQVGLLYPNAEAERGSLCPDLAQSTTNAVVQLQHTCGDRKTVQ